MRLPWLVAAVGAASRDGAADEAEVECVVANLVARKWIRGYLSHRPPVLVLAKQAAFKPMSEVLGWAAAAAAGPGRGAGGRGGSSSAMDEG